MMINFSHLFFADLVPNNFLFISELFKLCEEHILKLSSFTAIFQVLLVIGFGYNSLPRIKNILEVYMSADYKIYRIGLKQEVEKIQQKIDNILLVLHWEENTEDEFKLFSYAKRVRALENKVKNKKKLLLRNNSHSFLILGLYCFIILIGCGLEGIINDGREYLRFKNVLIFFNPLMMVYMINHYQHNLLKIKDTLFHHIAFIILFCLIAFTCCFLIDHTFNIFWIILSTFCVLLLPFIYICFTYLELRSNKVETDYLDEISSIEENLNREFVI